MEKNRKEMLKKLLLDMHKGVDIKILKEQFKQAVGDISSIEIGKLEQQLMDEGFLDPSEISKLSDLHVELFRDALNVKEEYESTPGHPIHTYLQENLEITNLISPTITKIRNYSLWNRFYFIKFKNQK